MTLLGRIIVLLFTAASSVIAVLNTSKLNAFDSQGLPGPRLWPLVCAALVMVLTIINAIELIPQLKTIDKKIDKKKLLRAGVFYIALLVFTLFISKYLGFFTTMIIFLFASLLIWEKLKWTECLPVSIGLPLVMWLICSVILKMAQFPKGIFF